ncbi:MAG: M20/M25/M40 family metallo-hydrolase [Bacteroidia bacterium]|nr:M20/M25/M40 family metallo-hydrolase [Bacteroidia bacterium]
MAKLPKNIKEIIVRLIDIIAQLEKIKDRERYDWIIKYLMSQQIKPSIHSYKTGKNIFIKSRSYPFIGIGSHYDTVPLTPGANDNASAIVVCLELAQRLKRNPLKNLGCEIYFFDEEEKGLLGSMAWIEEKGLKGMLGFLNMEMVGSGDQFAIWPVREEKQTPLLRTFEQNAKKLGIPTHRIDRIVMNTADHESFNIAGMEDAFTISCICEKDLEVAYHYYRALEFEVSHQTLYEIMSQAPIFEHYHQASDRSVNLSETSLQMTVDAIWESLQDMDANYR